MLLNASVCSRAQDVNRKNLIKSSGDMIKRIALSNTGKFQTLWQIALKQRSHDSSMLNSIEQKSANIRRALRFVKKEPMAKQRNHWVHANYYLLQRMSLTPFAQSIRNFPTARNVLYPPLLCLLVLYSQRRIYYVRFGVPPLDPVKEALKCVPDI